MSLFHEFFGDPLKHSEREKKAQQAKRAQPTRAPHRLRRGDLLVARDESVQKPKRMNAETESKGLSSFSPQLRLKIASLLVLTVASWVLWKPLGAWLAITSVGYLRQPLQRGAPFWSQPAVVPLGLLLGVGYAIFVGVLAHLAVQSLWARLLLGLWGFLAIGYFGYGISPYHYLRQPGEEKAADAAFIAQLSYLAVAGLTLAWRLAQQHL